MANVGDPADTAGRLIAASKVNGTSVYNAKGEKLGSVYDVMIDKASGKADYAILSFGGFLGIGEKYHPLPWNQLKYDIRQGGYVVGLDRQRLEGAPSYSASEVSVWDERRAQDVDAYYGSSTGLGGPGGTVLGKPSPLVPLRNCCRMAAPILHRGGLFPVRRSAPQPNPWPAPFRSMNSTPGRRSILAPSPATAYPSPAGSARAASS